MAAQQSMSSSICRQGVLGFLGAAMLLAAASSAFSGTLYVWTNSPGPASPYATWATAAHDIQSAVNAAAAGDTVMATNGTYLLTNQISITKAVTVRSVNGPGETIVNGNYPACTNRCFLVTNGNAVVEGFTITNARCAGDGGGVYLRYGATVRNCLISGNMARDGNGGGVYINASGMVDLCSVVGNVATGKMYGGGGVFFYAGGTATNSTIAWNLAVITNAPGYNAGGGGVFLHAGGVIQNCTIASNNAQLLAGFGGGGGAMYISGGSIINSIISGNTNNSRAGGAFLNSGGTLRNCLIVNNKGPTQAGGVTVYPPGTVQNCTIAGNQGNSGLTVYGYSNTLMLLENCVVVSNYTFAGSLANWSLVNQTTNIYVVNTCTYPTNFPAGVNASGCVSNAPLFMDYPSGNYRLSGDSPCIDSGVNQAWMTNAVDLDGCGRIQGLAVDMGAYEYVRHYVWTNSPSPASPYASWDTAAHDIQSAVNAAAAGSTIWVTNGTYSLTNQISITKAVTVRSVNGREATIVNGNYPACTNRCFLVTNGNAVVEGFTITNARCAGDGGGVYLRYGATVRNCLISGNMARDGNGGGVYINASGMVDLCSVVGNVATGKMYGGGGVFFYAGGTATNSTIAWNLAVITNASGYYAGGGGVFLHAGGVIQNCTIASNNAQLLAGFGGGGGAMYVAGGSIIDSIISGNTNNSRAGGAFLSSGGTLRNCLIVNNKGGVTQAGGVTVYPPGTVQNCTIAGNQGYSGLTVYGYSNTLMLLENCVAVSNYTFAGSLANWSLVNQTTNIYVVNTCTYPTNFPAGVNKSGCISNAPSFMDYPSGNYRLSGDSPCIDGGVNQSWMTNAVDLDGYGRIQGFAVDMGAYEFTPVYAQDFEISDPFWQGPHSQDSVAFHGITNETPYTGTKCWKVDVTFTNTGYSYWYMSFPEVPADNGLAFDVRAKVTGDTPVNGVFKYANTNFSQFSQNSLQSVGLFTADGQWHNMQVDMNAAFQQLATASGFNESPWYHTRYYALDSPIGGKEGFFGLRLSGTNGQHVVVYLDAMRVYGEAPGMAEYNQTLASQAAGYSNTLNNLLNGYGCLLDEIDQGLAALTNLALTANDIARKNEVQAMSTTQRSRVAACRAAKKILLSDMSDIERIIAEMQVAINGIWEVATARAAGEKFLTYGLLTPTTDYKVLPSAIYDVGNAGQVTQQLSVTACRGEYEPVSFVMTAIQRLSNFSLTVSGLQDISDPANVITGAVDVKLIKCWYQNDGGAWTAPVYVPELLLNNGDLVTVDEVTTNNYLLVTLTNGATTNVCISVTNEPSPAWYSPYWYSGVKCPVYDSATLQAYTIQSNRNQQYWLTVHVPADAIAGTYTGTVSLTTNGVSVGSLALQLRVLPFELAEPYYTPSLYYPMRLPDGATEIDRQIMKAELADLVTHGFSNPNVYQNMNRTDYTCDTNLTAQVLNLRQEVGIDNGTLYYLGMSWCWSANYTNASVITNIQAQAQSFMNYVSQYGVTQVYFYGKDEAIGTNLTAQRPAWEAIRSVGGKMFVAGYQGSNFPLMGDIQDLLICCGDPSISEAANWHGVNHKIMCYANPQGCYENPALYRRNHGLLIWTRDYDGIMDWVYYGSANDPWNDFDYIYYATPGYTRELCFVYPAGNGVIDTVQWEGCREAIDDVRYLTTLLYAITEGKESADPGIRALALAAEQYLNALDATTCDLDATRATIVDYILALMGY